jgi:hypothetical protein
MGKRCDIFRRCSGLTSDIFGSKNYDTVSLSLFLSACQFLSRLLYYWRWYKSGKFAILYVKRRESCGNGNEVGNYVIQSVQKSWFVVARAHLGISNMHMYHCTSSSCNIMKTTLLRNMQIQTIIA